MVSLVLVGAIVWSLFTPEESDRDEEVRLLYSNREDCAADWNTNCEPASGNTTSTGSGSYYRGPLMRQNSARSNRSIGREVVRRGGFGGMGRFFSRGG